MMRGNGDPDAPCELRPLDLSPAGVAEIAALLASAFPGAQRFTPEYVDWLYNDNPAGRAIGLNAYRSAKLVGHFGAVPVRARLFGKSVLGVQSLNSAVAPECQGRGVFGGLGAPLFECLSQAGFAFVMGVPNRNSSHVYVKKWGFQLVGSLQARVCLGPLSHEAQARGSSVDYEREWDDDTSRWRIRNPSADYVLHARGARTEVRARTGYPFVCALLGDLNHSVSKGAPRTRRPLQLDLFIGCDPDLRPPRWRSVNLPTFLRPAPLHLIFKDLTGGSRQLELSRTRYSALDFDAY